MVDPTLILMETLVLLFYLDDSKAVIQECSEVCDFYEWGKEAECQGRALESVPQGCLHAKTLKMQDNRLVKLAQGSFRNFTCLKYLYLERNNMTVEVGAFEGCSRLEKVHLNQNHLPILTKGILNGMPRVLYMFLNNASVHEIQPRAFGNMSQLKFLSLEDNRLNTPPCDAFSIDSSLETLYLTGNNISYLPNNCFSGFSRLIKLYLKRNPLVNPNLFAFKGLESLTLLDLQFTNLTEVPTGIFQNAINIEKLYLSFNNISHLSNRDFMSLYRLTHLYLQHNNLIVIQEQSFEFLSALHTLDLSFNRISSIRENALSHLSNIRDIKLQNNLLTSTRNISFNTLPNETKVNFTHNPLHCDCFLEPFLAWSKASSTNVLDGSLSTSHNARCSSPPVFKGRLVLGIRRDDICSEEPGVSFESHTVSAPDMEREERVDLSKTSAFPATVVTVIAVVVILIIVVVIVSVALLRRRKQSIRKRQRHDLETNIQITTNPLDTAILRGHRQITSPSPPSPIPVDDPYYISINGESPCQSPVHPPLHHPMPPRFSSQSNMNQDGIIYSSVLPDGDPQRTTDNDVTYTSVQHDDTDSGPVTRPLSMMNEMPIEEWMRKNCRLDSGTSPSGTTHNSETKLTGNAGSPYITMITHT
ncbi:SLIT and NTRK-like protein 6 [Strongylocentrotus purpuratus]|uniref:LRRCT domain-containing protein n=1 Tax=Strongylocentrotus purpuratus TaxID=7668 RepID=A0A7M7N3K4_STRPU|nr:SLIT and NTRK-like protein 6 [Strongylocentrotus purpuratus]